MIEEIARADFDSPWKEALEHHFPEFMALLFPHIHREVDWARGYQPMDKELQQVVRDAELGRRYADKLIKVHTVSGTEHLVLVHVEVQGEPEAGFDERMYVYNYRLFDRYRMEVVSVAVLADDRPDFRAGNYTRARWGCELRFRYPAVKLLELGGEPGLLEASDNPFALVVLAHLKARESRDGVTRLSSKLRLVRLLFQRGYDRKRVLELFRVIDWLMRLPHELELEFERELTSIEESKKMAYITSIERLGMERGMERGLQQGRLEGESAVLLLQLDRKFGPRLSDEHRARIAAADADTLLRWSGNLLDAESLDEVFR